jgi:hypothetical protein
MKNKVYIQGGDKEVHKETKIKGIVGVKIFTPGLWKLFSLEKG